jgi:hypothetical protein
MHDVWEELEISIKLAPFNVSTITFAIIYIHASELYKYVAQVHGHVFHIKFQD